MLDQLTVTDFVAHVNSSFPILLGAEDFLDLELMEARTLGESRPVPPGIRQQPFSLILRGPGDRPLAAYLSTEASHAGNAGHLSGAAGAGGRLPGTALSGGLQLIVDQAGRTDLALNSSQPASRVNRVLRGYHDGRTLRR